MLRFALLLLCAGPVLAAEKLADEHQPYTLTAETEVAYCATATDSQCEWRKLPAGTRECSNEAWGKDPQQGVLKACWRKEPEEAWCWPLNPLSYGLASIPEAVSTRYTHAIWFTDTCNGKVRVQPGNAAMMWDALANKTQFTSSDSINAYRASRPRLPLNDLETAWYRAFITEKAPKATVKPLTGSTSRPLVDASKKSVSGRIAIGKPCDANKRIGGTDYYSVAGQLSTTGVVLGDVYAQCVLQ